MLKLFFQIDRKRYVIDSRFVREVIPHVLPSPIASLPDYITGILNYRGKMIPILDLCYLITKKYAKERMSTRIIVVEDPNLTVSLFGFVAEHVTNVLEKKGEDFTDHGFTLKKMSFISRVFEDADGVIYELDIFELSRHLGDVVLKQV